MSVLFIAVPVALLFAGSAVIAFLWAAKSGQLDDLETPPLRMLHDDSEGRDGRALETEPAQARPETGATTTASGA